MDYEEFINQRCYEMWGCKATDLHLYEVDKITKLQVYVRDYRNPQWWPVKVHGNITLDVSSVGQVKDYYTGKDIPVYCIERRYPWAEVTGEDGVVYKEPVHRLVALAFLPNPNHYNEIKIINGKMDFVWAGNLAWWQGDQTYETDYEFLQAMKPYLFDSTRYPEHRTKHVAELLVFREDLTFQEISNITDVDAMQVKAIYEGRRCRWLKKRYEFKPRNILGGDTDCSQKTLTN